MEKVVWLTQQTEVTSSVAMCDGETTGLSHRLPVWAEFFLDNPRSQCFCSILTVTVELACITMFGRNRYKESVCPFTFCWRIWFPMSSSLSREALMSLTNKPCTLTSAILISPRELENKMQRSWKDYFRLISRTDLEWCFERCLHVVYETSTT